MTSEQHLNADQAKKCLKEQLNRIGDIEQRELKNEGEHTLLVYLKSMCDPVMINDNLINRFYELNSLDLYEQFLRSFPSSMEPKDEQELLRNILRGCVAIFIRDRVLLLTPSWLMPVSSSLPARRTLFRVPMIRLRRISR